MQAEGKLAAGTAKKYPNAIKAYGIIRRYAKHTSNILPRCKGFTYYLFTYHTIAAGSKYQCIPYEH